MTVSAAIALYVAAVLIWSVADTVRDYLEWKAERDRQMDECIARLSPPAPEDPEHKAKYQHLRGVRQ